MNDRTATTVIAEGANAGLREIQSTLRRAGIDSEIVRPPPGQCAGGG